MTHKEQVFRISFFIQVFDSVMGNIETMNNVQGLNALLMKSIQLSYLQCIKYFGLPIAKIIKTSTTTSLPLVSV